MTRVGVAWRLATLAAAFGLLAPLQALGMRRGWRIARAIPVRFHRLFLTLFGVRVTVMGDPPGPSTPTLVLANHVSWLDIPVLAGLRPLSFVAKSEIAGWPVIGGLARLGATIFLDRSRKAATAEVNALVANRLADGDAIVLFPEGTTGDGVRLLPFRTSLVGAARAALAGPDRAVIPADGQGLAAIRLQPLAVVYGRRNGLPVTRREMPDIAWYGDMELAPHLATFVAGGPLDVTIVWCDPIPFGPGADRKRATAGAEAAVRAAIEAVRMGAAPARLFS